MKEDLVMMGPLMDSVMQLLDEAYTVHRYWEADDKAAFLADVAERCKGVVTDGGLGVSADVLKQLPNARVVSVYGVGVDAVDLDYCRDHGISVGNTPDVLSDDVADLAIALALATSRSLVLGDAYARAGRWPTEGAMPLTHRMSAKRAGIFGMGSIGNSLAQRLTGFNMSISYCNRRQRNDSPHTFVPSLLELARHSDFLFITASATSDSVGAVNAEVLQALGEDGILVNVSRGTLVDEPALIQALAEGGIRGAGLDVFAAEPQIPEALYALDNVVLQPHHASGTWETRRAMGQLVIDNLQAHFAGKPLLTPVV